MFSMLIFVFFHNSFIIEIVIFLSWRAQQKREEILNYNKCLCASRLFSRSSDSCGCMVCWDVKIDDGTLVFRCLYDGEIRMEMTCVQ